MSGLTIPYLVPLYLGMSWSAWNSLPGVDIYPQHCVNNPVTTPAKETKTHYTIIESLSDVKKELGVSGDLSLKIKSGMLNVEGKGSYIRNVRNYINIVEIIVTLKYTHSVQTFKQGCSPRKGWLKDYTPQVLGTHYVSSIRYGAEMVASLRFEVFDSDDLQEVKGAVKAAFHTNGDAVDLTAEGKLENLKKSVEGKANLAISYYGTVPLKSIPNDIAGFRKLTNTFKQQVIDAGLENGLPMEVELTPLEDIADEENRDKFRFDKSKNLQSKLPDFENKLDELRKARLELTSWAKGLPYHLEEQYEKEVGRLIKNITHCLNTFYEVCWKLNVTQGPEQLKPAYDAYNYDGKPASNRFHRLVTRLIKRLNPLIKRSEVAADTYIQWGKSNCTALSTQVLYEGFATSSTDEGLAGMGQYECAPRSPVRGYQVDNSRFRSQLAGIRYSELEKGINPFEGPNAKLIAGTGVPCAKCYSPDSASVVMFSATETCPLTWETMYTGYLMSHVILRGSSSTQYICVDDTPAQGYKMDAKYSSFDTLDLTVVHPDGSLPKEQYVQNALIRCVVCAMKSNQISL